MFAALCPPLPGILDQARASPEPSAPAVTTNSLEGIGEFGSFWRKVLSLWQKKGETQAPLREFPQRWGLGSLAGNKVANHHSHRPLLSNTGEQSMPLWQVEKPLGKEPEGRRGSGDTPPTRGSVGREILCPSWHPGPPQTPQGFCISSEPRSSPGQSGPLPGRLTRAPAPLPQPRLASSDSSGWGLCLGWRLSFVQEAECPR